MVKQQKSPSLLTGFFVVLVGRREFAILASQCACMRIGVHRLAAVLLEFPVHPASVPDAASIPESQSQ
jgi:hypothetical protein